MGSITGNTAVYFCSSSRIHTFKIGAVCPPCHATGTLSGKMEINYMNHIIWHIALSKTESTIFQGGIEIGIIFSGHLQSFLSFPLISVIKRFLTLCFAQHFASALALPRPSWW